MQFPWNKPCQSVDQIAAYAKRRGGKIPGKLGFLMTQYQDDSQVGEYMSQAKGSFAVTVTEDGSQVIFSPAIQSIADKELPMSSMQVTDELLDALGTIAAVRAFRGIAS